MNIRPVYAHSASSFALAPGARARRGDSAAGLIFLSFIVCPMGRGVHLPVSFSWLRKPPEVNPRGPT